MQGTVCAWFYLFVLLSNALCAYMLNIVYRSAEVPTVYS